MFRQSAQMGLNHIYTYMYTVIILLPQPYDQITYPDHYDRGKSPTRFRSLIIFYK